MSLSYVLAYVKWLLMTTAWWKIAAYLCCINLLCYAAYALDKRAARQGGWRISEASLHMLALLGGSPAAYVAQRRLRHKTKKASFQLYFKLGVAVQCVVLMAVLLFG